MSEIDKIDPWDKPFVQEGTPFNASEMIEAENTKVNSGWAKGISGNPKGRPKGALNKLNQLFYKDLYQDWDKHGIQAIESMRLDSPTKYCQLVATVLPKTLQLDTQDGINWVINASPVKSISDWQAKHGLTPTDSDT